MPAIILTAIATSVPEYNIESHVMRDTHGYLSHYKGTKYRSAISPEQFREMPSWDPRITGRPPLSPGDALAKAAAVVEELFPETKWEYPTISLQLVGSVTKQWKWIYWVRFFERTEGEADGSVTLVSFPVLILMNGECIRPVVETEKETSSNGTIQPDAHTSRR